MSFINRVKIANLTTDASGDVTGYADTGHSGGMLSAIRYVVDGTSPYDTGVDFTITEEDTGQAIITVTNAGTASLSLYPRIATVSTANAALLYAAGGAAVSDLMPIAGRIKVVVAQGGNTKIGNFYFYLA